MNSRLSRIFKKASHQTPTGLSEQVWLHVSLSMARKARARLYWSLAASCVSLAGLFPMLRELSVELGNSGVSEYVATAFSSQSTFVLYWKEIMYSIIDVLPTTSILLSLALVFIFLVYIRRVVRESYYLLQTA